LRSPVGQLRPGTSRVWKLHFLLLLLPFSVVAQALTTTPPADSTASPALRRLQRHEIHHGQALAAWALGNLVVGGTGMFFTHGQAHQFLHMNAAWGSINLPIGLWMWHHARQFSPLNTPDPDARTVRFRRVLLVNIGLDLSYIGAGLLLHRHGSTASEYAYAYRGFGQACVLQGVGLLTLDLISLRTLRRP
jgi:hypothetical protein